MTGPSDNRLQEHVTAVKEGRRSFENAFQAVTRMILEKEIRKVVVNGKTTYDFEIFRTGKKHIIGMYDELNSFVSYVKDAAEGGRAMAEMREAGRTEVSDPDIATPDDEVTPAEGAAEAEADVAEAGAEAKGNIKVGGAK